MPSCPFAAGLVNMLVFGCDYNSTNKLPFETAGMPNQKYQFLKMEYMDVICIKKRRKKRPSLADSNQKSGWCIDIGLIWNSSRSHPYWYSMPQLRFLPSLQHSSEVQHLRALLVLIIYFLLCSAKIHIISHQPWAVALDGTFMATLPSFSNHLK